MVSVLRDKRILITGASYGLGAVCAREFARMGAQLALVARSAEKLEQVRRSCCNRGRHLAVAADLADSCQLQEAVKKAQGFLGRIDAALHVAGGGLGLREPLIEAADLLRLFELNVMAAVRINRIIAPQMLKRGRGSLVHVASIAASEATASVGYNTVKSALAAYVRSLGNELAGSGVVVTGILPGGFLAPGNAWERLMARDPGAARRFIKKQLPRRRLADARELIPLLAFLCSDDASMMSGCLVPIDAGEGRAYQQC
jgi:3-oxoacyl-[acyl-carrier protein] reductase